jgi:hypothetical protein
VQCTLAVKLDGSNVCFAEFGAGLGARAGDPEYRSCVFVDIGPPATAARDVEFDSHERFSAVIGERWGVGQVVVVTKKTGLGNCDAAGGEFVVDSVEGCTAKSSITCGQPAAGATQCPDNTGDCVFTADPGGSNQGSCALTDQAACTASLDVDTDGTACSALLCTYSSHAVVLDAIAGRALQTRIISGQANVNNACQIAGTTNLVSTSGGPCYACPAGKEPGSGGDAGSCVTCPPGRFSTEKSTCHVCPAGTTWGPLMSLGATITTAVDGCVYCGPGTYNVHGLKVIPVSGDEVEIEMATLGATCRSQAGRGYDANDANGEQLADCESFAECAELVMTTRPDANGLSYCGSGSTVSSITGQTLPCDIKSCWSFSSMLGIATQDVQYESCFLDRECQTCEAGKQHARVTTWETGHAMGGNSEQLANCVDADACAELVMSTRPLANGATFAGQGCYAEFGMTGNDPNERHAVSAQFTLTGADGSDQLEDAESFLDGEGVGANHMYVGTTVDSATCAARVKQRQPSANGATYWAFASAEAGYNNQVCFAEYGMTEISLAFQWCSLYQSTFFQNTGCENCSAGQASEYAGASCNQCGGGKEPRQNNTVCLSCEAGKYSREGENSCSICPEGKVTTNAGSVACEVCATSEAPSRDQSSCFSCASEDNNQAGLDADNYASYDKAVHRCECPSTVDGSAYYNHVHSWSRANSCGLDGGASCNFTASMLPWVMYSESDSGADLTDGWLSTVQIAVDRSNLASLYRSLDQDDELESVYLHNTYFLQCLTDGVQEEGSKPQFRTVISNSLSAPSSNGIASCVNCASAAECVTCCNEYLQSDDGSFDWPTNCSVGDHGRPIAVPKAGWWRTSTASPLLHRCPVLAACLGGHDTLCDVDSGYKQGSIMCASCQLGYMKYAGECFECPAVGWSYLTAFGSIIGTILYFSFLVRNNNKSVHVPTAEEVIQPGTTQTAEKLTVSFKIMLAYLHLINMMRDFDLPWPTVVSDSADAISKVTDPSMLTTAYPCFFSSSTDTDSTMAFSLIQSVMQMLMPLLCVVAPCAYYGIARLRDHSKHDPTDENDWGFSDRMMSAVVVLLFQFHTPASTATFTLFDCIEIEEGLSVWNVDQGVECNEGYHKTIEWWLGVPSLLITVVGVPFVAAWTMRHFRNMPVGPDEHLMLYQVRIQRRFGFLYKGYETQFYYWELCVLGRKLTFILIEVLSDMVGPVIQTVLALGTVQVALLLHVHCEPYKLDEIDQMERLSLIASSFTLLAGLFYYARVNGEKGTSEDAPDDTVSVCCTCLVFAVNLAVILNFFSFLLLGVQENLREIRQKRRVKVADLRHAERWESQSELISPTETDGSSKAAAAAAAAAAVADGGDTSASRQLAWGGEKRRKQQAPLPQAFTAKHKMLDKGMAQIAAICGDLKQLVVELPGFSSEVAAVLRWMERLQSAVEWKAKQADSVVRRHIWEGQQQQQEEEQEEELQEEGGGGCDSPPKFGKPSPRMQTRDGATQLS